MVWQDQLHHAVSTCKGLLSLSVQRLTDGYQSKARIWFILFLVFVSLSAIAITTLLYLISKMRCFVSLRKSVLSSIQDRENRGPNTPGLLPVNTRLTVRGSYTTSSWAPPHSSRYSTSNIDLARVNSITPVNGPRDQTPTKTA